MHTVHIGERPLYSHQKSMLSLQSFHRMCIVFTSHISTAIRVYKQPLDDSIRQINCVHFNDFYIYVSTS